MARINESLVEQATKNWFEELGYATGFAPTDITIGVDRKGADDPILWNRVRNAVIRLNPGITDNAADAVLDRIAQPDTTDPVTENKRVHDLMIKGVTVESQDSEGFATTDLFRLIDFENHNNNDWYVVNQVAIAEVGHPRRPDVVMYLNGLPVALFELKNPAAENATMKSAWNQIQTYRHDIPSIFLTNALTVISDGTSAAMSTFTGAFEHFAPWKAIDGPTVIKGRPALEVLIKGVFDKQRFLDILKNFIVFSSEPVQSDKSDIVTRKLVKRSAKYHQFWAVNAAVESTVKASSPNGDKRGGVVWHTQGSGKSFEMVFFAGKIMRDPRMHNPTLVFITDRNDLDDQLFGEVFSPAHILPETPQQAESRVDLRERLKVASGGIVFTTMHKFAPGEDGDMNPVLTDRRNVVVVADEAHRSQYGFNQTLDDKGKIKAGLAKHLRDALPGATFLGFTGTPIESTDRSTRAVFGDYIDVYDLTRAVEDGATVKIFYESRLARIAVDDADLENIDTVVEGADSEETRKAKSKWSRLEALVGAEERLKTVAEDIVTHWDKRQEKMRGKAMIVTMSRRIAVALYEEITTLRPEWHSDDLNKGKIKVVMTGSASDPAEFQKHIYSQDDRRKLKLRAKDPDDELEIVIVRDMWLTGFDAPSMHTMYVDKPMQGANLMQAIARVNRVFKDKPAGLIVDYIGLFDSLQKALGEYSPSDRDQAGVPVAELVAVLMEKHNVVSSMLRPTGFDSSPELSATERLTEYAKVIDFVLADDALTKRFNNETLALAKAYAIVGSREEVKHLEDDIRLFIDVRSAVLKVLNPDSGQTTDGKGKDLDSVLSQLLNDAVTANKVIDVYASADMENPELSLLSDEFLNSMKKSDKPNLQMGLLRKLLNDEIRSMSKRNVVQSRKFSEMLSDAVKRYTNRSLTTAEIIAELVKLAKEMRDEKKREEDLGLSSAEVAVYDAIIRNDSAVLKMGDDTLKQIALEIVSTIRSSATIDWAHKETVRARMRTKIKRLLRRYKYPPDQQEDAVRLVIEQAELIAAA